jgi:V/A-type H+/Na+-transporting ATPase subunit D
MRLRIPPGRAGRLWLRDRISAARGAADLLDRKRRELETELHRMGTIAQRRERDWRAKGAEAEQWLDRVDDTGGDRALRVAAALEPDPSEVRLDWQRVMGVHYPTDFHLTLPPTPTVASLDGGAALEFAIEAYKAAVTAAVAHAVARTAEERIRTDLDRTIRRLRALRLRAIPAHDEALRALEVRLDEKDREEAVAARWSSEEARSSTASDSR